MASQGLLGLALCGQSDSKRGPLEPRTACSGCATSQQKILRGCLSLARLSLHGNPLTLEQLRSADGFQEFNARRCASADKQVRCFPDWALRWNPQMLLRPYTGTAQNKRLTWIEKQEHACLQSSIECIVPGMTACNCILELGRV